MYKRSIEELNLTAIYLILYIPDASPQFPPCGTKVLLILWFQDAWRAVERRMESAINRARGCGGHEVHLIAD